MAYIRKETYSVEEVLSKFISPRLKLKNEDTLVDFDGDLISMDSHRYWTYKEKGCKCVKCGLEGTYFAKEKFKNDKSYHFNLYGINDKGKEVMMTKDHIIPKSRDGEDDIENYQPMCIECNNLKGNKTEKELTKIIKYKTHMEKFELKVLFRIRENIKKEMDKRKKELLTKLKSHEFCKDKIYSDLIDKKNILTKLIKLRENNRILEEAQ